jgi:hypothetical protein
MHYPTVSGLLGLSDCADAESSGEDFDCDVSLLNVIVGAVHHLSSDAALFRIIYTRTV